MDAKGNTKNFASLGLEEGDEVTIQGPKTTYGTTVELVDVTVLKINKSLIKVDSVYNDVLPVEGGIFEAYIITKGNGVSVEIPEDAKEWLSIVSIDQKGTDACVKFQAARNEGGDRSTSITFRTTDGKKITQARLNSHSRAPSLKLLLLNSLPPRLVLHNTALVV